MEEAVWHKFSQNLELKDELLATGESELFEVRRIFNVHNKIKIK